MKLSFYPSISRDMTVRIPEGLPFKAIGIAVEAFRDNSILESWHLSNTYRNGDGERLATLSFVYRSQDRTLTSDEANRDQERLSEAIGSLTRPAAETAYGDQLEGWINEMYEKGYRPGYAAAGTEEIIKEKA